MHNATDALGYAGAIVWSLAHDEGSVVGAHYGFAYTDPATRQPDSSAVEVRQHAAARQRVRAAIIARLIQHSA